MDPDTHFKKKKKIYEDLIDLNLLGQAENYSITDGLIASLSESRKISMDECLEAWKKFLSNKKEKDISLYIHIPYCVEKCHYCFSKSYKLKNEKEIADYLDKLIDYLVFYADHFKGVEFSSFYMGGGNPSILKEDQLDKLLSVVFSNYEFVDNAEKTVENDPRTASKEKFKVMKKYGINRVSMGVQSLNPDVLKASNRLGQTEEDVRKAVSVAKEVGFPVFNIDLMVGLKGDNKKSVVKSFSKIAKMEPDQISIYSLQPKGGYLNDILEIKKDEFYEKKRKLYKKSLLEIEKIAEEKNYFLVSSSEMSDDFNNAASITFEKKDLKHSFYRAYVARPVKKRCSILAVGQGADSTIGKKIKLNSGNELTKDPMQYSFHGWIMTTNEASLSFLLNIISVRKKIGILTLIEEFDFEHLKKIMRVFSQLEKRDLATIKKESIYLHFNSARESFLYSLFFLPEEKVINLAYSRLTKTMSKRESKKIDLSRIKPLTEDSFRKIKKKIRGKGVEIIDGTIIEKCDEGLIVNINEDNTKKFIKYNPKKIFTIKEFLDYNSDYKSILKTKIKIRNLKIGDDVSLSINNEGEILLIIKIVVI